VADIDAALGQQVLNLAQRRRLSDLHHHRQADNLGRRIEITEWVSHPTRPKNGFVCLKPICSDTALFSADADCLYFLAAPPTPGV
jgi:hypothetical protein